MAKTDYPSDKLDQYMVRFPDGMRDELKHWAMVSKRSLNAEIVARLEKSLADEAAPHSANRDELGPVADYIDERIDEVLKVLGHLQTLIINGKLGE